MSTEVKAKTTANAGNKHRHPRKNPAKQAKKPAVKKAHQQEEEGTSSSQDDEDGELCFICTEPIKTFAVAQCDHRTCHKCTLRLRALYDTRNCAYCKAEQKLVIFTQNAEKPFENYNADDTPFTDKKLNIKFETQDMYKEAMHMLEYNCPHTGCSETFKNWGELKLHVRKSHSLNICDLCSRHKKIFPYEHTLYTSAQLTKHHREGDKEFNKDDETGFSGHPECAFCKIRFFGDDELFVHCRDQHEQCFLCVRNGNRHEYYANYASLEDHFKSDHCMCLYPQCLEKKFVVFDSPIDLKAHEVEVHGESIAGLQRSMQTQNRQLELNFQYESYRHQRENSNNRRGGGGAGGKKKEDSTQKTDHRQNTAASGSSTPSRTAIRPDDFPSINQVNEALTASTATPATSQPRTIPGASTKKSKGKGKALQKPAGFGALSAPLAVNNSGESSGAGAGGSGTSNLDHQDPTVVSHTAFLSKVSDMLQSKAKVNEFRSLTSAFRKSILSGEDYVNQIVKLTNNNVEQSGKILRGVEDLLDMEDKKWELIRVWRNKYTAMTNFPALDVRERAPMQASRVLVIKPKQTKKVVGGTSKSKNVWDKVASAANVANNMASRPSSAQSSIRSSPQTSRPSSPVNTYRPSSSVNNKTPWSGTSSTSTSTASKSAQDFPSLKPKTFPALPAAAPKHQMILNMRRQASGQGAINAWSSGGSSSEDVSESAAEDSLSAASSSGKKKKGRKNNVLFRVGL
ncbi:C2H2 finger domain protein [Mucor ambiguus]|uniref:RING-type E3 ubiquitin transferase n=1 Tax=Mucor ambiguus TaxID=91626 RepID=A0A0C9MPS7_9FUNG|nr:C2H2 finger domain protein [Mucor ambiguus]